MSNTPANLCLEPACLEASAQILANLAPDYKQYDPCTQFDQMVCSGFWERNQAGLEGMQTGFLYSRRIEKIILESDYEFAANYTSSIKRSDDDTATDRANFEKLQKGYNACMDGDAIDEAGLAPLLEFVEKIDELFPVTGNQSSLLTPEEYPNLQAAMLYLSIYGIPNLGQFTIDLNAKNTSEQIVRLLPPQNSLQNGTAYTDPAAMEDWATQLKGLFKIMSSAGGGNVSDDVLTSLANGVVNLELELFNTGLDEAVISETESHGEDGTTIAVDELDKLAPALGYKNILLEMVPKTVTLKTLAVTSTTRIKLVNEVVKKTPKSVLQIWLALRAIGALQSYVSSPLLGGTSAGTDRAEICLKHVDTTLMFIMARFYVTSSFSTSKREVGSQMMTDIRTQFIKRIESLSWMSAEVKKRAINKVNNIQQNIGYPSAPDSELDLLDPKALAALYQDQEVTDSYFANQLAYQKWYGEFQASKLGRPTDRGEFMDALDQTNAAYYPSLNIITIYAGIMQGATFDPALPSYANYGALGAVLGHELTHGFDNTGRLYDEHGSRTAWWDDATVAAFEERAQCFANQYGKMTYPTPEGERNVNGTHTLGENIADNGGAHTAYDAWQANRDKAELSMPGLGMFTHEQLFYVFYANMWCSSMTPAQVESAYAKDEHSPGPIRVKGLMQNSRGFKQAFNCPNKEPVCELW